MKRSNAIAIAIAVAVAVAVAVSAAAVVVVVVVVGRFLGNTLPAETQSKFGNTTSVTASPPPPGAPGNYTHGCFTDHSIYVSGGKYWRAEYVDNGIFEWKYTGQVRRVNSDLVVITPDKSQPPILYWKLSLSKAICGR